MKKLLLSATVVAGLFAAPTIDSLQKQINELQQQLKELKAKQETQNDRYYKKVAPIVANNHLFWNLDLRTTYDVIKEDVKSGMGYKTIVPNQDGSVTFKDMGKIDSKTYKNHIFTNRVILTGVYKPSDNLKATVKAEVNNVFGMNAADRSSPYQNISWVANETPDDTNFRLKEAYFNYFFGDDFMFSAGRRPATEGFPANLREGNEPSSPLAHLINMEFDGFSFKIGNGEFSKLSDKFGDWGTWLKFCLGRGYSSTQGKWPYNNDPANSKDRLHNADFGGFLFVPYDNGQYSIWTETVWAWDMKGYNFATPADAANAMAGKDFTVSMQDLGNYFGFNMILKADGIGDGISDFLDDTKAFVSYAISKTKPDSGKQMLGSTDKETGHSVWVGADMPGFKDGDRFGVSYVHGSKYWRNFTFGEDTLIGSIAAVRGHAFDVYYNTEIIPHLTAGLRYTYIKYDHAGSDSFFGLAGNPDQDVYVEKARDLRAFIRYNF
jgi:hypothetical protein